MSNYSSALKRIKACTTHEDMNKMADALVRLHSNNVLTDNEYMRLDVKWCNHMIDLGLV
mgnify:CR=1 FL=1|jgi:hypothetical protein